eukprot:436423-Rhodomonas_salina.1
MPERFCALPGGDGAVQRGHGHMRVQRSAGQQLPRLLLRPRPVEVQLPRFDGQVLCRRSAAVQGLHMLGGSQRGPGQRQEPLPGGRLGGRRGPGVGEQDGGGGGQQQRLDADARA